jgi:4-amino-4-deoxy-L-arabinose transferase-like glycosyltransferase
VYVLGGAEELVMRLPPFTAGLAALLLMIPLARRLLGWPAWIWAFGLSALSHHALTHGREVHPYTFDLYQ